MTELSHGIIKANIVQFVWPEPSNKPQWISCDRAHLFKTLASMLHTSNTRIDKAYKELIKKGIIKILKESGFRGSSKHQVRLTENDTVIQLLSVQKRIVYFEETGKKHFPNMFKKDFMINNFVVKDGKFVGAKRKATKRNQAWNQLDLNMPYSVNPKYQNDFDAYCWTMDNLFKDISILAITNNYDLIDKEYDYVIRNLTIRALDVIMDSMQNRLDAQGNHKLTPKSAYNMRKRWELLIQIRMRVHWLIQIEKKDEFSNHLIPNASQLNKIMKDRPALELTAEEKKYFKMKA